MYTALKDAHYMPIEEVCELIGREECINIYTTSNDPSLIRLTLMRKSYDISLGFAKIYRSNLSRYNALDLDKLDLTILVGYEYVPYQVIIDLYNSISDFQLRNIFTSRLLSADIIKILIGIGSSNTDDIKFGIIVDTTINNMYIHDVICDTLSTNRIDRLLYIRNGIGRPIGLYCDSINNISLSMIPLLIDDRIVKKDSTNNLILGLINDDKTDYIRSIIKNKFSIHELYQISTQVSNKNNTTRYIEAVFNNDV